MRNRSRIIRSGLWPLAVFLVFTAAAVWAGYAFFERLKQEEKAQAASTLTSVGKLKAEQIRSYFERNEKFALSIARLLGQGGLADWLDGAPSEMPRPLQESLLIVLRNRVGSGLLVLDTTANVRFGAGQFTRLTEEGRRLALLAMTEPPPVASDIYRGDPSAPEQALLDTFVPIQGPGRDRTVGVLVLRDDLAYLYDLIQAWPVESPTAESVLVRLDGDHALFLNELRFRKQTALRMRVPLSASQGFPGWPSTAAVRGQVGIWEARDYLDHAILAYTLPVAGPVPGWGMVVKMELAEVFAPVQRLKNTTIGVTVSFILLALLALGSWLWLLQRNADREIAEGQSIRQLNDQLEQRVRERTAELEQANLLIQESEARFRTMVEGVTDYAILMLDPDGRVVSWNAGAERLKGYRADEIIGQPFSCFYPEQDVALGKPARELETAASEGRLEDEGWRVRQDGSRFWANVVITALRDEAGQLRGFSKITRDLTERRQADETLELERSKLAAAFANTNMGLVLSDGQGGNITMNAAALRFHGFTSVADMHGRLDEFADEWELRDPDGRIIPFAGWPLSRAIRGDSFRDCEVHLRSLKTPYEWVCSYTGVLVPNSAGEVGLIVLTLLDITERKRAEEEQKQARAVLARTAQSLALSNRELEEFTSIASHDLQEPLRKIVAFGDRLETRCREALSEEGHDYLDRMRRAAARMSTLIEDLLQLSRVGTKPEPFQRVLLASVVSEALEDLEETVTRTGGHVAIGSLPTLVASRLQMRRLFQNLIGNALKFHKEGEPPAVRVEGRSLGDGRLEIVVADNGIGFDEKYLDRVFRPFQRLHGRSEFEGTGMGLAICHKIVARHGGTLTARSRPGEGSRFVVTLPERPPVH